MINCPFNNSCTKLYCDLSCKEFSEFEHWSNRCSITLKNPSILSDTKQLSIANKLIYDAINSETLTDSNYSNISIYSDNNSQYIADLTTYLAITLYCKNIGFYNGVYKLDFSKYLEEIKKSWNTRYNSVILEDMKIWIHSSKFLVICNLGLVRFGDFESQTLLSIFQDRYDSDKYTIITLDKGQYALLGKPDSLFYLKLKSELKERGAKL